MSDGRDARTAGQEPSPRASAGDGGGDGGRPPGRIALLSDVHGNLPALEAVLADIDGRDGILGVYHLGDLVGYAPWPNEVVARLEERGIAGVAGNYDSTTAVRHEHCGCRYEDPRDQELAHESYAWTLEAVSGETRRRLTALPFRLDLRPLGGHAAGPVMTLVHGAPSLNTLYWTEDRSDGFCRKMADKAGRSAGDAMAFGHTHLPWTRVLDGVRFVNTGSVGRPKDGDPRAGYALLTPPAGSAGGDRPDPPDRSEGDRPGGDGGAAGGAGTWAVEHVRVAYDVERAARAIEESTLPDAFAEQLREGGR